MSKLILEDRVIRNLMRDPKFLEAWPFMQSGLTAIQQVESALKPTDCKPCHAKTSNALPSIYNQVKQALAGLSPTEAKKFLEMTNSTRVEFVYKSLGTGKVIRGILG